MKKDARDRLIFELDLEVRQTSATVHKMWEDLSSTLEKLIDIVQDQKEQTQSTVDTLAELKKQQESYNKHKAELASLRFSEDDEEEALDVTDLAGSL